MENKLYIDTSDNKRTVVRLEIEGETYEEIMEHGVQKAQVTLPLIEKVLSRSGLRLEQIDRIFVAKGPGSFTGLRVGVSIANALSFALGRSINDKDLGKIEKPTY